MISFTYKGDFKKIDSYFQNVLEKVKLDKLNIIGQRGVEALAAATPVRSGLTASSWSYDIVRTNTSVEIVWKNSNFNDGVPIALIIQYGHGTGTGGYVQGIDYINPAMRPIFEELTDWAWKEVTSA